MQHVFDDIQLQQLGSFKGSSACHHKHLRRITGHQWPNILISNKALQDIQQYSINKGSTTTMVHIQSNATDAHRNNDTKIPEIFSKRIQQLPGTKGPPLDKLSWVATGISSKYRTRSPKIWQATEERTLTKERTEWLQMKGWMLL